MNTLISICPHHVHLWLVKLSDFTTFEQPLLALLSSDEKVRAQRFHFPLHRQRFIIARGLLRKTLSLYTNIAAEKIAFTLGPQGKPYLQDNILDLQFNISHSADFAVFAFTTQTEIGVDIEKIEPSFNQAVAQRFFSQQEYEQLITLSAEKKIKGFYEIWSKKEAVVKALGEGLFASLGDFTVSIGDAKESIILTHLLRKYSYYVESFQVPDDYQAAFATLAPIEKVVWKKFPTPL